MIFLEEKIISTYPDDIAIYPVWTQPPTPLFSGWNIETYLNIVAYFYITLFTIKDHCLTNEMNGVLSHGTAL